MAEVEALPPIPVPPVKAAVAAATAGVVLQSAAPVAPVEAPSYAPVPAGPPQGLGIASMVLGLAGLVLSLFYGIGFLPALAAVITGHIGQRRQKHAKPFWLTGIISGYLGIAISLVWLVGLFAVIALGIGFLSDSNSG